MYGHNMNSNNIFHRSGHLKCKKMQKGAKITEVHLIFGAKIA